MVRVASPDHDIRSASYRPRYTFPLVLHTFLRGLMEYRQLGGSGLKVPVLGLGTAPFGGTNEFFQAFGGLDAARATQLVDVCLDAGANLFDSSDAYSAGQAEEILRQALRGRRHHALISTKGAFRTGPGPNDLGSSRHHLDVVGCEAPKTTFDCVDRRATARQPWRYGLDVDLRASGGARQSERADAGVSLLAPARLRCKGDWQNRAANRAELAAAAPVGRHTDHRRA